MKTKRTTEAAVAAALLGLLAGCTQPEPTRWQGYLEGEYVYVAAPGGGELEALQVRRGDRVEPGAPLFALNRTLEVSAREVAVQRLEQARARWADLGKGVRPSELAAVEARLAQAQAAAELSALEEQRVARLFADRVVSTDEFDRARLTHARNEALVRELAAQRETARLGARADQRAAAEAEVAAAAAQLSAADWSLAQRAPDAPVAGLVHDTLFLPGETVGPGQPVVVLLPPQNVKVRFFVPEEARARLAAGVAVRVSISGRAEPVPARISHLSPKPEYTPPVLYNRENRAKLVFMVEAEFDPAAAVELLPGQPVDVARAEQ